MIQCHHHLTADLLFILILILFYFKIFPRHPSSLFSGKDFSSACIYFLYIFLTMTEESHIGEIVVGGRWMKQWQLLTRSLFTNIYIHM